MIIRHSFRSLLLPITLLAVLLFASALSAAGLDRFAGSYSGKAEIVVEGESVERDLSTTITPKDDGFVLSWTSVSYKSDGRTKESTYTIEFVPSARDNIYRSAMKTNLFGKAVPLDPLAGDPFVWARLEGDTFSVFSLFINEVGDYEIQEFHRTLVDQGLNLLFRRVHNGVPQREIRALLTRME